MNTSPEPKSETTQESHGVRSAEEVEQIFTIADLRARLDAEQAARLSMVRAYIDALVDLQGAKADARELAAQVDTLVARVAELADENQLLRDDALDAPVPFSISEPVKAISLGGHLAAVPIQRDGQARA